MLIRVCISGRVRATKTNFARGPSCVNSRRVLSLELLQPQSVAARGEPVGRRFPPKRSMRNRRTHLGLDPKRAGDGIVGLRTGGFGGAGELGRVGRKLIGLDGSNKRQAKAKKPRTRQVDPSHTGANKPRPEARTLGAAGPTLRPPVSHTPPSSYTPHDAACYTGPTAAGRIVLRPRPPHLRYAHSVDRVLVRSWAGGALT